MKIRRTGKGLLATAAVASVLVLTACGDTSSSSEEPEIRDVGATDDPAPGRSLGEANLLTDKDAIYPNGGSDWRATNTYPGDGQAAFSPCAQGGLSGLGADSVLQRDFEFVVRDTGDVEPTLTLNEIVGEFGRDADAEAAYGEIRAWLEDCLPPEADEYDAGPFTSVPIAGGGRAEVQLSTYRPVPPELDPYGDEGWFLETGLVLSGDRVAVLTQLTHGQDYNWPDGTPVEQMLPAAAARLIGDEPAASPTTSPDSTAGTGVIPDDIPLEVDMWDAGSDGEYHGAYRPDGEVVVEVGLCGNRVWPLGHWEGPPVTDELATWATGPEYSDTRDLITLPSAGDAVRVVQLVRDALDGCAREGHTVWTVHDEDTGYDSVTFSATYDNSLGSSVYQVTRVGPAVLFTAGYGEGSIDTVDAAARTRTAITRKIAGHLCVLTAAGC